MQSVTEIFLIKTFNLNKIRIPVFSTGSTDQLQILVTGSIPCNSKFCKHISKSELMDINVQVAWISKMELAQSEV